MTSTGPVSPPMSKGSCFANHSVAATPIPGDGPRYRALSFSQSRPQPVFTRMASPGCRLRLLSGQGLLQIIDGNLVGRGKHLNSLQGRHINQHAARKHHAHLFDPKPRKP